VPAPDPDLDELELIRRSGVALRTGKLCLSAGHGSYRVKAAMARVAHALGIDRHEAHVTLTEITATSHRGRSFRTEVAEVRAIGVNADRLAELERFTRGLEQRRQAHAAPATVEGVTAELDRISGKPPLYPVLLNAAWAAIACAAFAFLNNGGPVEVLAVLVAAGLGQAGRRILLHRGWNQFGVTMLAAAVASLAYLGIVGVLRLAGITAIQHESGYLSAVLFLIPGFALVTAALDLAKLDFSAGIARLVYGLMIVTSAALVVWGVSAAVGLRPQPVEPLSLAPVVLLALRLAASWVGVLGFALMFNSPWAMALGAASIGMVANVGRLELIGLGMPTQAAAAAAALVVGLLAALVGPRLDVPTITVSVPAVVIMVPGVTAYRAVYYLSTGETIRALDYAVQACLVVLALAIGLAVARMLTDRTWGLEH
jgi:uncharacterized membrane protein YjjP (DUF1212 family)